MHSSLSSARYPAIGLRNVRGELTTNGVIQKADSVTGRDGKTYQTGIERQPRGQSEGKSSDGEGGGGQGGGFSKGKGDPGNPGGSINELEGEARSMIRKGEMDPFELPKLLTATGHDYAATVITLLDAMKPELKQRTEGLQRIKRWLDQKLESGA